MHVQGINSGEPLQGDCSANLKLVKTPQSPESLSSYTRLATRRAYDGTPYAAPRRSGAPTSRDRLRRPHEAVPACSPPGPTAPQASPPVCRRLPTGYSTVVLDFPLFWAYSTCTYFVKLEYFYQSYGRRIALSLSQNSRRVISEIRKDCCSSNAWQSMNQGLACGISL